MNRALWLSFMTIGLSFSDRKAGDFPRAGETVGSSHRSAYAVGENQAADAVPFDFQAFLVGAASIDRDEMRSIP